MNARAGLCLSLALTLVAASTASGQAPSSSAGARTPATVEGWVELLRTGRPADQERATTALIGAGRRAEQPLLAALQDPRLSGAAAARALDVLYAVDAPSTLDAMLAAARHAQPERRAAAADYLTNYKADDRACQALVLLVQDGDPSVALAAVASARGVEAAFTPLLERVVLPRLRDEPDAPIVREGIGSLRLTLVQRGSTERVIQVLRACAELTDPAAQVRLFGVLTENQVPAAAPFLRWVLVGAPAEEPEVERSPAEEDVLRAAADLFQEEAIQLLVATPGVRPAAIRGLVRSGAPGAPALACDLLRDRDAEVRAAALSVLQVPPAPFSVERERCVEALVTLLTDADRNIRRTAHKLLTITTKEQLPLNAPRWIEWLTAERARMGRWRELEALARDNGYESVDALLEDHPDLTPAAVEEEQQ